MKLIILDRDGVINRDSDNYIRSAEEWQPLPGAFSAIARLCDGGFTVVVATNQSGLGRGLFDLDDLEAMHDKMREGAEDAGGMISAVYYCPHTPDDECHCRKPLPGLLDAIQQDFDLPNLHHVPVVGDSLRDLQAAVARGCQAILVRTGKGGEYEASLSDNEFLSNSLVFDDLPGVATYLLDRL